MSTNIELAELDYVSGMKYKDIAAKYDVKLATVKSWKTRYNWSREKDKKVCIQNKKSTHTKTEKVCIQNHDANTEDKVRKKVVESVASNDELNEQQKLFCLYFTDNPNATRAYQKAFKVNRLTAQSSGCRLLTNGKVKAEIDRLRQIKYAAIMFNADDIVERNMRIAFSDMTDFTDIGIEESKVLNSDGAVKRDDKGKPIIIKYNTVLVKDSSELDGAVIQEVRATKDGVSIKLKDSTKAMDWLTKYFKLNPLDKHREAFDNAKLELDRKKAAALEKDTGQDGLAEIMKKARERVSNVKTE